MNLWGLRLLALTLALVGWFIVTGESREPLSEKVIQAAVRYNKPNDLLILNPVEQVRVGVRGPVSQLGGLNPQSVEVVVDLGNETGTEIEVALGPEAVFLPVASLEVVSVEPNLLSLELDREVSELLPVVPRLMGEPAAGAIARQPVSVPNRALVRGPETRVRGLTTVTTTPVDVTGHAIDFEARAAVLPPDPRVTIVQPAIVTVKVSFDIPSAENNGGDPAP